MVLACHLILQDQGLKNCVHARVRERTVHTKALFSQLELFPSEKTICTASPKRFWQYKINVCSLNPPYFFKCCTKSDCLYFDTTHILS